jgi:hypothetical protein
VLVAFQLCSATAKTEKKSLHEHIFESIMQSPLVEAEIFQVFELSRIEILYVFVTLPFAWLLLRLSHLT